MPTQPKARVELSLTDGTVIDAWQSFSLRDEFTDPLGSFEFTVAPPRGRVSHYRDRLVKGEKAILSIDGKVQATTVIQTVRTTVGPDVGVAFQIECVNPIVVLYEGHVDSTFSKHFQSDSPLKDLVTDVIGEFGLTLSTSDPIADIGIKSGVNINNRAEKIQLDKLKTSDAQAHENETAYAFLARICTRLGAAIRCAQDGTVMLTVPHYDQSPMYTVLQSRFGGTADRFIGSIVEESTNEGQYSQCEVKGSGYDKVGLALTAKPRAVVTSSEVTPGRPAYSSSYLPYKPLVISDKNARDLVRCKNVAKLALGLRAARAYSITGTVGGVIAETGAVWSVDTLASVQIEALGVDEVMWLLGRKMTMDTEGGTRTELTLIPKGSLVLGDLP